MLIYIIQKESPGKGHSNRNDYQVLIFVSFLDHYDKEVAWNQIPQMRTQLNS